MPLYEYECGKCGVFEHSQRMSDPVLTKCPTCRRKIRRLISSTSFQLKGTGWYVTDYAKSGKGEAREATKDSKPASDAAKSEPAKTESAPATTTKADTKSGD